jgi:hypothetical protein
MNKKNVKTLILYISISIIVIVAIVEIYNYFRNVSVTEGTISYNIYYVNTSEQKLDIEERIVNYVDDDSTMFNTVVDEFTSGPSSTNQKLALPSEFKIKSKKFNKKTAYIDLESSFNNLKNTDQILSLGSLVYTLTDMSFIDGVIVTVNGKPVLSQEGQDPILLNRQNVRNNPVIDPEKTEWQTVTLYFSDRSGAKLVSEQRSVEIKKSLSLEYQIVEQLIIGPDKKMLKSAIPEKTSIRDIKTENGICYVNLSKDFINSNPVGITTDTVKIYSIVDSLTELSSVNKVQFLIEGEKVNEVNDNIDFSKPFDRNNEILKVIQ